MLKRWFVFGYTNSVSCVVGSWHTKKTYYYQKTLKLNTLNVPKFIWHTRKHKLKIFDEPEVVLNDSNNAMQIDSVYSASGASAMRRVPVPQAAWGEMSEKSSQSQSAVRHLLAAFLILLETSSRY